LTKSSKTDSRLDLIVEPLICGVDEAGRGPLAGPVVAAAVILPGNFDYSGIADSKKLSPAQREIQRERIINSARAWGIGIVEHDIIDKINILQASLLAMKMAVDNMRMAPGMVLVDGNFVIPGLEIPQKAIIRGDSTEPSIGAASILAKTARDELMMDLDFRYPGYGFARHKGYPTKEHIERLNRLGPSPIHRRSFHPVCRMVEEKRD